METTEKAKITIQASIDAPIDTVWKCWTTPEHIIKWNYASDDWHTPWAVNDLRVGGTFTSRMEAKDRSDGFDFGGVYDNVVANEFIEYTLGDGRKVQVVFKSLGNKTEIVETFEAEGTNPIDVQRDGWRSILSNFKNYTEHILIKA